MESRKKRNVSIDCPRSINRRITRSMSLKNGIDFSLLIPMDVILMIFLKLPLKSIARCRCVSKLWASILRCSDFTELFLNKSCSTTPKLLFTYRNRGELFIFSSPQPQNPDENSSPVICNYQMKISFRGYFKYNDLVHGLIYLEDLQILKGNLRKVLKICNPSTGQVIILPKVKTRRNTTVSLFGYDPIDKQYKVLAMSTTKQRMCGEYQVLTLPSGNMSWKMIECCIPHNPPRRYICVNGVLYYTSIFRLPETSLIVCFDIRSEKFTFIKTMETFKGAVPSGRIELINYNGKLGLLLCEQGVQFVLLNGRNIRFKLWVLEDLEKQLWSDHAFLFPNVPENLVGLVSFIGVTQTSEIVFSSCYNPFYLFYLNSEKKTIVRVKIQKKEAAKGAIYHTFLNHVEDVKLYANV